MADGERPIVFSDQMVHALLAGRKTQTRRPIRPQPFPSVDGACMWPNGGWQWRLMGGMEPSSLPSFRCPYGQWGDRLWVQETWRWAPGTRIRGPSPSTTAPTAAPSAVAQAQEAWPRELVTRSYPERVLEVAEHAVVCVRYLWTGLQLYRELIHSLEVNDGVFVHPRTNETERTLARVRAWEKGEL